MELGLRDAEFWRLTPGEFRDLAHAWRRRNQHWEYMLAQSAYLFYEANRTERAPERALEDFMLTKSEHAAAPAPAAAAAKLPTAAQIEAYFVSLPGVKRA